MVVTVENPQESVFSGSEHGFKLLLPKCIELPPFISLHSHVCLHDHACYTRVCENIG